jgi:hypothetical protein
VIALQQVASQDMLLHVACGGKAIFHVPSTVGALCCL